MRKPLPLTMVEDKNLETLRKNDWCLMIMDCDIPAEIASRWTKIAGDRFLRNDGCEITADRIQGSRRWFAMVPAFNGDRRTGWQGLRIEDGVTFFRSYRDAIFAVEDYVNKHILTKN